jgi:hypothetical protein
VSELKKNLLLASSIKSGISLLSGWGKSFSNVVWIEKISLSLVALHEGTEKLYGVLGPAAC